MHFERRCDPLQLHCNELEDTAVKLQYINHLIRCSGTATSKKFLQCNCRISIT